MPLDPRLEGPLRVRGSGLDPTRRARSSLRIERHVLGVVHGSPRALIAGTTRGSQQPPASLAESTPCMETTLQPTDADPSLQGARRKWKRALVIGLILCCGPVLGLLGTVVGVMYSFERIEALPAPTPDDLAVGVHLSLSAEVIGLLAAVIGAPLACWSYVRLNKLRREGESAFWK